MQSRRGGFGLVRAASLFGLVAAIGIGWWALNRPPIDADASSSGLPGKSSKRRSAPMPVVMTRVELRNLKQTLQVTGSLRTDQDVRIGSRLSGRVGRVLVKEGDRVKVGQLLVALDDGDLRAQLARSGASARAAESRFRQLSGSREYRIVQLRKELGQATLGVASAQAKLRQAEVQASITESETAARVQSAQANVEVAKERLKILKDGARKQELQQAALAVTQSRVELENAKRHHERRVRLFAKDAIAREEVDEAEAKMMVAEATHQAALERQTLITEGARSEEIRVAEQAVRAAEESLREAEGQRARRTVSQEDIRAAQAVQVQAQSALEAARVAQTQDKAIDEEIQAADAAVAQSAADSNYYESQLRDTVIRSPVNGVVTRRMVNPGESVTATSTLLNIVALDSIYLEAQVPEIDLSQVRTGMTTVVEVDSLAEHRFTGIVREIIPVADPAEKVFRVRVAVYGRAGAPQLPPGGFARASIDVGQRRNALTIPKSAVRSETGQRFVYTVVEREARRVSVKTGLADSLYVEVLSGLSRNDIIIASASPTLADGVPVTSVRPSAQ